TLAQFVGVLTGSSHDRHPSGSSMSPSNPGRFNLCRRGIPAVRHPLHDGRGEWVETFHSDITAFLEGQIPA
ncbi:hypothetical protein, partial [Streptomyces sp. NPDC048385]|uniref:hypothetical protein n=1 Tax=Streptomyces sp. NPDC048385 TaxID=3155145 RepID=UPI00342BBE2F